MTSAATVNLSFATPGGGTTPADPLAISVNYAGTTQYGSAYAVSYTHLDVYKRQRLHAADHR